MALADSAQALREGWPALTVHGADEARAVAEAAAGLAPGRGALLVSAPGAGWYGGAGWFLALARAAAAAVPEARLAVLLDCGALPGAVLDGLRAGAPALVFTGPAPAAGRLAALAAARGAVLLAAAPSALDCATLDLARPQGRQALARWLDGPT